MKRPPVVYLVRPSGGRGHVSTSCGRTMGVPILPVCAEPLDERDGWAFTESRPSRVCHGCEQDGVG